MPNCYPIIAVGIYFQILLNQDSVWTWCLSSKTGAGKTKETEAHTHHHIVGWIQSDLPSLNRLRNDFI